MTNSLNTSHEQLPEILSPGQLGYLFAKSLRQYAPEKEKLFFKMACFYYFDLYKVETGTPQSSMEIAKLLTIEQADALLSRWKNDMMHILGLNLHDNMKKIPQEKVADVVKNLATSIADAQGEDFFTICFRMVLESKKKRKIMHQSLKLQDELTKILPSNTHQRLFDYVRERYNSSEKPMQKDSFLFENIVTHPHDIFPLFFSLSAEMDISYTIENESVIQKLLIAHSKRKPIAFSPLAEHKDLKVTNIVEQDDEYKIDVEYQDKAVSSNTLQGLFENSFSHMKKKLLKKESNEKVLTPEEEEICESKYAYSYHALRDLQKNVIPLLSSERSYTYTHTSSQQMMKLIEMKYGSDVSAFFSATKFGSHVEVTYGLDTEGDTISITSQLDEVRLDISQPDRIRLTYLQDGQEKGEQILYVLPDKYALSPYTAPASIGAIKERTSKFGIDEYIHHLVTKNKQQGVDTDPYYFDLKKKIQDRVGQHPEHEQDDFFARYLIEETVTSNLDVRKFFPSENTAKKNLSKTNQHAVINSPQKAHRKYIYAIYQKMAGITEKKKNIDAAVAKIGLTKTTKMALAKQLQTLFEEYRSTPEKKAFYGEIFTTLHIVPYNTTKEIENEALRLHNKLALLAHRYKLYTDTLKRLGVSEISEPIIADLMLNNWEVLKKTTQYLYTSLDQERRVKQYLKLREEREQYTFEKLVNSKLNSILKYDRPLRIPVLYAHLKIYGVLDFIHSPKASPAHKAWIKQAIVDYINDQIKVWEEDVTLPGQKVLSYISAHEVSLRICAYNAIKAMVLENTEEHANYLTEAKALIALMTGKIHAHVEENKKKEYAGKKRRTPPTNKLTLEKRIKKYFSRFPGIESTVISVQNEETRQMETVIIELDSPEQKIEYTTEEYHKFLFDKMFGRTPYYVQKYLEKGAQGGENSSDYRFNYLRMIEYIKPITDDLPYINKTHAKLCMDEVDEKEKAWGVKKTAQIFLLSHLKKLIAYLIKSHCLEDFIENYLHIDDPALKHKFIEWIRVYVKNHSYKKKEQVALVGSYEFHLAYWSEFMKTPTASELTMHGKTQVVLPKIKEERLDQAWHASTARRVKDILTQTSEDEIRS